MFTSSIQLEVEYIKAKVDFAKLQIAKAKASKKATKELEKKLQFNLALLKQLEARKNATIE